MTAATPHSCSRGHGMCIDGANGVTEPSSHLAMSQLSRYWLWWWFVLHNILKAQAFSIRLQCTGLGDNSRKAEEAKWYLKEDSKQQNQWCWWWYRRHRLALQSFRCSITRDTSKWEFINDFLNTKLNNNILIKKNFMMDCAGHSEPSERDDEFFMKQMRGNSRWMLERPAAIVEVSLRKI